MATAAGLGATCAGWGCSSEPLPTQGLDSPSGSARVEAMGQAVRNPTHEGVGDLIRSLQSDDPLTRAAAIYSLRQITGTDRGYVADDPPVRRREAVERWVAWYELEPSGKPANTSPGASGPAGVKSPPVELADRRR